MAPLITRNILGDICRVALNLGEQGLAFATLCVVFFCVAWLLSLVPYSSSVIDCSRIVTLADVELHELRLKWSKAYQNSAAGILIPLLPSKTNSFCIPVLVLSKLIF